MILVPITEWKSIYEDYVWFTFLSATPENGLAKASGADAFQVKSLSEIRLINRIGRVTEPQLSAIAAAIALCVGYEHPRTLGA